MKPTISNNRELQKQLHRKLIMEMSKQSIKGINTTEFGELILDSMDQRKTPKQIEKIVQEKYGVDKETSHLMVHTVIKKANIISAYLIAKERKAKCSSLDSPYNDKYDGMKLPMDKFMELVPFMVETYASPTFHRKC
ncbi:MAG: hypothetical protein J6Y78_04090 [Paludibacteraceae bacterium]|nr:hypothetical protein [Paludibacteraceae bacterium]